MTWIPSLRWFLEPSGGPTAGWPAWFDRHKRRPILAHPIGMALVVWAFWGLWTLFHSVVVLIVAGALLAEATNQFHKASRGAYGATLWLNVIWRLVLAGVGIGLAWLVIGALS